MKKLLSQYLMFIFCLKLTELVYPGLKISTGWFGLASAGIWFILINNLIKPILKIILLPLNLITFGLFKWILEIVSFSAVFYLSTHLSVSSYYFPGIASKTIIIPALNITPVISLVIIYGFIKIWQWVLLFIGDGFSS